jgi:hypothetical protein
MESSNIPLLKILFNKGIFYEILPSPLIENGYLYYDKHNQFAFIDCDFFQDFIGYIYAFLKKE